MKNAAIVASRASNSLDLASIQTLHSFAAALLQERPLEAGLPPSFETLDAIASDLAFEEAWAQWIDAALDDAALQPPLAMAFSLGMTVANLRAIARKFHENYDLLTDARFDAPVRDAVPSPPLSCVSCWASLTNLSGCANTPGLATMISWYAHTQAKLTSIRQLRGAGRRFACRLPHAVPHPAVKAARRTSTVTGIMTLCRTRTPASI